jgi:transcriptional regulator with XRE-family HTH domain
MNTKSKTIAEMAAALADNPSVEQDVQKEIQRNAMVSYLLSLRVSKGLTQEQVATAMGCDASKISRLESGNDETLKWGDIADYTSALNVQMFVLVEDPTLPAAERIKQCVFSIHEHLNDLTELARQVGSDDKIARKINEFSGEVLFNFLLQYQDHRENLRSVFKFAPINQPTLCASEPASTPAIESSDKVLA